MSLCRLEDRFVLVSGLFVPALCGFDNGSVQVETPVGEDWFLTGALTFWILQNASLDAAFRNA